MALTSDILRSYRAPGQVVRRLQTLDRREGRLLFYLMLASGLIFVAQWPRLARLSQMDDTIPFQGLMTGALFGLMFVFPLVAYAFAWALGMLLRIVWRGTDGFDVRLALFWSLLAISPLMLLHGLVQGIVGVAGPQATLVGVVVFAGFVFMAGAGLRAAVRKA